MSTGRFTRADRAPAARGFDWAGIERSRGFGELVRARRRFVVPVAIVFFVIVAAYLLLVSFAHGLMSKQVAGMPLAYLAALTQVLLTWVVTWLYLRRADSTLAPMERRVAESVQAPEQEAQR